MNKFAIPLVVFGLLVVAFAVSLHRAPERQFVKSALIGKPAADFVAPDLLKPGETFDSRSLRGRWVLLNVWGSWCPTCVDENPVLLDIKREGKVVVVGLNYQDDDENARKWLRDLGNPFDVVPVDKEGRVSIDYGVYGAPESFLINPEGIIVHKVVSEITTQKWREEFLPLIEGSAP